MAKKSFASKLAEGFVRSAVNQVGRDGGRVISNKVYKDAHSTPIRRANESAAHYAKRVEEQPQPVFLSSHPIMYGVSFLGSLILSPVAVLYHFYSWIKYILLFKSYPDQEGKSVFLIKSICHLLLAVFFGWVAYSVYQGFKSL